MSWNWNATANQTCVYCFYSGDKIRRASAYTVGERGERGPRDLTPPSTQDAGVRSHARVTLTVSAHASVIHRHRGIGESRIANGENAVREQRHSAATTSYSSVQRPELRIHVVCDHVYRVLYYTSVQYTRQLNHGHAPCSIP